MRQLCAAVFAEFAEFAAWNDIYMGGLS